MFKIDSVFCLCIDFCILFSAHEKYSIDEMHDMLAWRLWSCLKATLRELGQKKYCNVWFVVVFHLITSIF